MMSNKMIKRSLMASALVCGMASLASVAPANAALIAELEAIGTATNNTLLTAEFIPGAAFTAPEPVTVFPRPGSVTATINGNGGGDDVDFYSFLLSGGDHFKVLFDIDNDPFTFDTVLSLFDSTGTLIAFDDDSFPGPDLGTESDLDSFIGTIVLSPGAYYVAVSQFSNFATATFGGTSFSSLTRPDGAFGGERVSGATPGDSTFGISGSNNISTPYTLHISTVVPEPASLALLGIGLAGLGFVRRRRQD